MNSPLLRYPFRFRDPLTGKWIRARYLAQRHVIAERYVEWETTGTPEIRRDVGGSFNPFRNPASHLPPVEEPPPDPNAPPPSPPDNEPPDPPVEEPPPVDDRHLRASTVNHRCALENARTRSARRASLDKLRLETPWSESLRPADHHPPDEETPPDHGPTPDPPPDEQPPPVGDQLERFLVLLFLRRYVTYCARTRKFAAMEGAARLFRASS